MGRIWTLAAAVALTLACTPNQLDGGPDSAVRLDTQAAVGWEPGGPYNLQLVVYNATGYRMLMVDPNKEALQVKIFRLSDGQLACKTPSPTHKQYEGWFVKAVRAAAGLKLDVDVWPYCRNLLPGVYRYEAVYLANPAVGSNNNVWTGTLGPQGGRIAIGFGLSSDEAALAATLANPAVAVQEQPVSAAPTAPVPAEATQPAAAEAEGAAPAAEKPAEAAPTAAAEKPAAVAKPAPPPASPEAIRACVDRELAARGLNAYGDPQGTRYEDRPPVDEGGRILYVASRSAEIRVACKIPGF